MANNWSDDELESAARVYLEMQRKYDNGEYFTKREYYKMLHNKFGRTLKSFEYRMQNISYVLLTMGLKYLPGLPPAKNVGANVIKKIKRILENLIKGDGCVVCESEDFIYTGETCINWVRSNANGVCELCAKSAPFIGNDGQPYLEIHHIKSLKEGGYNSISNIVALCPNCHRELHNGVDSKKRLEDLKKRIARITIL